MIDSSRQCVCMYVCVYVCMCVCVYVRMYGFMYVRQPSLHESPPPFAFQKVNPSWKINLPQTPSLNLKLTRPLNPTQRQTLTVNPRQSWHHTLTPRPISNLNTKLNPSMSMNLILMLKLRPNPSGSVALSERCRDGCIPPQRHEPGRCEYVPGHRITSYLVVAGVVCGVGSHVLHTHTHTRIHTRAYTHEVKFMYLPELIHTQLLQPSASPPASPPRAHTYGVSVVHKCMMHALPPTTVGKWLKVHSNQDNNIFIYRYIPSFFIYRTPLALFTEGRNKLDCLDIFQKIIQFFLLNPIRKLGNKTQSTSFFKN